MRQDGPDEWARFEPAWHAGFGALVLLTAILLGAVRGLRQAGGAYVAAAAPLTLGLFMVAPVGALMLFALYPHIWLMLPVRRAIPATAVVVAGVVAVTIARDGLDDSTLAGVGLLAAVSLALALVLGLWIGRIIRQSRQRADLIAQLAAAREELAELSREAGALAERERLAYEIHDTLAQGFTSVLLLLQAVEGDLIADPAAARRHLDRAREIARENLAELRALVAALVPPDLTRTSLAVCHPSMRWPCCERRRRH